MLEKSYASYSRTRIIQVKKELQTLKKGILGINGYMLKIKLYVDELQEVASGYLKNRSL